MALIILGLLLFIIALVYWLFMSPYSQIFGKYIWRINTTEKVVALTFDDGPNEPHTSELLRILKMNGIKATFFQVGNCIKRSPETTKKIYSDGHTIGSHSVSHEFHNYLLHPFFKQEIEDNQKIIKSQIGKFPNLYRSPWLWRQPFIFKTLKNNGLTPVSGIFCDPLEIFQLSAEKIANSTLKKIKPGSIIIFHDGKEGKGGERSKTIEAVRLVIESLKNDGYKFVTVDKLLDIPAYQN